MKEKAKTGFEKFIDEFDAKYRKRMYEKQKIKPIILNLFEQYEEDIYTQSTLDKEIHNLQLEISNKLQDKCTEEQNELIEQLQYCIWAENGELVEKAFIYGFCVAQSFKEEALEYVKNRK